MRLIQYVGSDGNRAVGIVVDHDRVAPIRDCISTVELANAAISSNASLADAAEMRRSSVFQDYQELVDDKRLLPPVDVVDAARCFVTGTGLTHLGSAATRDAMHRTDDEEQLDEPITDSMRMFRLGLDGGKPAAGAVGVQPEWFYKGNGSIVASPEAPLRSPAFALDGGEEPEIAGIYLIAADGTPLRLGFALSNEFSDHVMERQNYLYLAHSKLRPCSFGPELLLGELPVDIRGTSRIRRDGEVVWQKPFLSGEENMSHWISNLEVHHFKYELFRQPGDLHVHMFGTATLSFADGFRARTGDVFEIEAAEFGRPLRNPLLEYDAGLVPVRTL